MGFMNLFKHFLGDDWGVHPDDHKRPAADQPVRVMPVPSRLYLPLQQHLGGPARASVLVGQKVLKGELIAEQLSWVSGQAPHTHWVYTAKPRYRTSDQPCEVERVDADSCEIRFAEPQWALTPGQSVVLYESRVCLGGGVIR